MVLERRISIAIIGTGPGGLGSAIALSELPFVSVKVYEQAPEAREVGAGISIGQNSWTTLNLLGAAERVKGASTAPTYQRNAYTGEIVDRQRYTPDKPKTSPQGPIRARRTRLQAALLAEVPPHTIEFNKKLVSLKDLGDDGVKLTFQDQTEVTADLVVAADGIRSLTRRTLFPDHHLHFTGNTAWRVLVSSSLVSRLNFPNETAWWHAKDGHLFSSHVDDESERALFELTLRSYHEPDIPGKSVMWAIPASNERVLARCQEYDPVIKEILAEVPEGEWREFAMFAGPCLKHVSGWDKVALIGDASHPLSGAFGSGAAFAMDDGWILARALEHCISSDTPVKDALQHFDEIRSPFYRRLYDYLDESGKALKQTRETFTEFEDLLRAKLAVLGATGDGTLDWIYQSDIQQVWEDYLDTIKQAES